MLTSDVLLESFYMPSSIRDVDETYRSYRDALEAVAAWGRDGRRDQMLREVAVLRQRYYAALHAFFWSRPSDDHFEAYQRERLHQEKTLAGLMQVILRHAVCRLVPARLSYSLLQRVRQITATHPAIAPPSFA